MIADPPWLLRSMWRDVAELAAMLRAYMAPEQPAPAPTWPRVASANVELEVARDAIEQAPGLDRVALFDGMTDVAYRYLEYKRYATRAIRGMFTIPQLDGLLRRWINRPASSSFHGVQPEAPNCRCTIEVDAFYQDIAVGDIIPTPVMAEAHHAGIRGHTANVVIVDEMQDFEIAHNAIGVSPQPPQPTEKPERKPARKMSPQMERERKRHRWRRA